LTRGWEIALFPKSAPIGVVTFIQTALRQRVDHSKRLELPLEGWAMYMSGESLLVILIVGLIAGWLAGQIVRGTGFGLMGDLVIGIIGAFIGGPQLGIHLAAGTIGAIINATIGAVLLLLIIRLVWGGSRWGSGFSDRWSRRW
jgi:uncharacterized membrane protein YeaQ/YmgE (transglycosylase-associated protein family)